MIFGGFHRDLMSVVPRFSNVMSVMSSYENHICQAMRAVFHQFFITFQFGFQQFFRFLISFTTVFITSLAVLSNSFQQVPMVSQWFSSFSHAFPMLYNRFPMVYSKLPISFSNSYQLVYSSFPIILHQFLSHFTVVS